MSTHIGDDPSGTNPVAFAPPRPAPTEQALRVVAVGDVDLHRRVTDAVLALGDHPPQGLTHAQEAAIGPRLLRAVITELGVDAVTIAADPVWRGTLCEVAGVAAPRLLALLTGHFALVIGAITAHGDGSDYQQGALGLLETGEAVGVLALTELGGTNGIDQTLTATWDHELDGFLLRTPSPAGVKFMPNVADATSNVVVVLARLIIDDIDHGVLGFLLPPLIGRTPDPSIRITALPEKVGSAMAHATIYFDDMVLPRHALLGGAWARITSDGRFESELSPTQRFRASISMLDAGRLDLAAAAVASARAALSGVLTYARQRTPGGTPMLERDTVRRDLVTGLARVWAYTALGRALYALPCDDPHRSLWSMLAKPAMSTAALEVLLNCQVLLGAQGTLRVNWVTDWISDTLALSIAEGVNPVMSLTAGRLRARITDDLDLPGTPEDLPAWAELLLSREVALVDAVRTGGTDYTTDALGPDSVAADAAQATAERAAATALRIFAAATTDPRARDLLETLAAAYACDRVLAHSDWYSIYRQLGPEHLGQIAEELRRARLHLLEELDLLIAAFTVPPLTGPVFGGDYLGYWTDHLQKDIG